MYYDISQYQSQIYKKNSIITNITKKQMYRKHLYKNLLHPDFQSHWMVIFLFIFPVSHLVRNSSNNCKASDLDEPTTKRYLPITLYPGIPLSFALKPSIQKCGKDLEIPQTIFIFAAQNC